jgi:hypothetical protein
MRRAQDQLASPPRTSVALHASDSAPTSMFPVFVLDKGRFTTFDTPGDGTELVDVNTRDRVAGGYIDAQDRRRGFVRDKRGRVTLFDYPGAERRTFVNKINDLGQIVGNAFVPAPSDDEGRRAYLRDPDGTFTTISVPGAVTTQALGLDDRGRVVGDYLDQSGSYHGYLRKRGRFTTIDFPGSTSTAITGLNDRGEMVGVYVDAHGAPHGVYRSTRGRIITIDAPGVINTVPFDVNARGQIVGFTAGGSLTELVFGTVHGFALMKGPRGPFTAVDVPGAPQTLASGIDNRGRIAGFYQNPKVAPAAQRSRAAMPLLHAPPLASGEKKGAR